jgi:hypothetical protein
MRTRQLAEIAGGCAVPVQKLSRFSGTITLIACQFTLKRFRRSFPKFTRVLTKDFRVDHSQQPHVCLKPLNLGGDFRVMKMNDTEALTRQFLRNCKVVQQPIKALRYFEWVTKEGKSR